MDVLLSHSYFLDQDPLERAVMKPYPPLGLLYLSAYLKRDGHDVAVLDTTFADYASARRQIQAARPKILGLYTNLMTRRHVVALAGMAKEVGALVVLGGPEAVNYAEEYLAHDGDVIVFGEGEATLSELVPHLLQHGLDRMDEIAGICFRGPDGQVVRTKARGLIKEIDALPFPDRGAIDLSRYLDTWQTHHGVRPVSLITARGCPYACQWCSHSVYGISYRHRSPANVIEELKVIRNDYQPDQVWYADDVFTMNHRWLNTYADALETAGMHYPFETISREDRLNEDVVKVLKRMGCYRLWVGAESGSQRILDSMQRRTDANRMREMITLLQDYGIRAGTFIMVGYDGEEFSDIRRTVRHLKSSRPDDVLTTLSYPIKGTPYYDKVSDRIVPQEDWATGSDREIRIRGRKSRRYYKAAQGWISSEVQFSKSIRGGVREAMRAPRILARSVRYRLTMWRSRHEREAQ